jgi:hypothetical protein
LQVRGVSQALSTSQTAERLFNYSDGQPAVTRTPVGKGSVYYSAGSLDEGSYPLFLDAVFELAGVDRPVRVRASGGGLPARVEARSVRTGSRHLLYATNFNGKSVDLEIEGGSAPFTLRELRDDREIQGIRISIPAHQTMIFELSAPEF